MATDLEVEDLNSTESTEEASTDNSSDKEKKNKDDVSNGKKHRQEKKKKADKKDKKRKRRGHLIRTAIAAVIITIGYCVCIWSNIPFIAKWRTIYIETAMSTMEHQWLATYFIPNYIVREIDQQKKTDLAAQKELESKWEEDTEEISTEELIDEESAFYEKYWELDTVSVKNYLKNHPELLKEGYDKILIEDFDQELGLTTSQGDPVVVIDTENNLFISAIIGPDYQGKMAVIKDSSQVDLVKARNFGTKGQLVEEFGADYDAVLAINGSHFIDVGGHGSGGSVKGSMVIDGVEYGTAKNGYWRYAGVKADGKLYISSYYTVDTTEYTWGVEAFPALIVDGENVVDNTLGMGIQPRTAIGQTENGDFLMLIVDGRQIGYSLGCTVADCAEILTRYNCYQALNMDGGSSSVMWYKGTQLTKSSSASGKGRFGPSALIVKKASLNLSNGSDCFNMLAQ